MKQITVGRHTYLIGKLNALQQFHIARRLGPVLIVAGIGIEALQQGMKVQSEDLFAVVAPAMDLMSKMSDDEVNYILFTALSVVSRKEGESGSAPLVASDGKRLMYADVELPELVRLVMATLEANLGNFLKEPSAAPTTQGS